MFKIKKCKLTNLKYSLKHVYKTTDTARNNGGLISKGSNTC